MQASLSIVCWRSLFKERSRWRRALTTQLILLLLMPAIMMTVGVMSLLQKSAVKSVTLLLYTYCALYKYTML